MNKHEYNSIVFRLDAILAMLFRILHMEGTNMAQIDDLVTEVAAQTTLVGSLQTFVQGLKDAIAAAGTDPVKIQAILDSVKANDMALAAVQNTPQE
jgi:hypothetical protein